MPWETTPVDPTGKLVAIKRLREDPLAHVRVDFSGIFLPGLRFMPDKVQTHDHIEEYYVLDGSFEDYQGGSEGHIRSAAGTYGFREPRSCPHGDDVALEIPVFKIKRGGWLPDTQKLRTASRTMTMPRVAFTE